MPKTNLGFHCNRLRYLSEAITDNDLIRGEFFNFPRDEFAALRKELISRNLARSIHSPLIKPDWYPDPPTWSFLCDVNKDSRNRTFKMISETLSHAQDIGAEYVIVHFPAPQTDAAGESAEKLLSIAQNSCARLAEMSLKQGMSIHIEGIMNSPYLNDNFLFELLNEYPLQYCFDTGHMHLAAIANGFDLYEFADRIAPNVGSIHLWNNRGIDDYTTFRHIPVHPSQDPEEGWVDLKRVLEIIQPSCPIIFESPLSYPEALGNHDYRDGITWIKEILETL